MNSLKLTTIALLAMTGIANAQTAPDTSLSTKAAEDAPGTSQPGPTDMPTVEPETGSLSDTSTTADGAGKTDMPAAEVKTNALSDDESVSPK